MTFTVMGKIGQALEGNGIIVLLHVIKDGRDIPVDGIFFHRVGSNGKSTVMPQQGNKECRYHCIEHRAGIWLTVQIFIIDPVKLAENTLVRAGWEAKVGIFIVSIKGFHDKIRQNIMPRQKAEEYPFKGGGADHQIVANTIIIKNAQGMGGMPAYDTDVSLA